MKKISLTIVLTFITLGAYQNCGQINSISGNRDNPFAKIVLPSDGFEKTIIPNSSEPMNASQLEAEKVGTNIGSPALQNYLPNIPPPGAASNSAPPSSPPPSAVPCVCLRTVISTTQSDGSLGVCYFPGRPGASPTDVSPGAHPSWGFSGGITANNCTGLNPANPQTHEILLGDVPSSCSITSTTQTNFTNPSSNSSPSLGNCTHQADTNYDGIVTAAERDIYDNVWNPPTTGTNNTTVAGVSNNCYDLFNIASALGMIGYAPGLTQQQFACARIDFAAGFNPSCRPQLINGFHCLPNGAVNTINSLDHCAAPGQPIAACSNP